MTLKEEWAAPEVLLDFQRVPDVLPLRPRGLLVDCDYNALLKWDRPYEPEEVKGEDGEIDPETPQGPPMDQHLFQYEKADADAKKDYLAKFELIRRRKVEFGEKRVCLINDPYAGARENIMPTIEERFNGAGVNYDTYTSEGNPVDAYRMIKDMENLGDYNLICVAGDDNTFQEVVNGMLAREDGVKLPLGFLPNAIEG